MLSLQEIIDNMAIVANEYPIKKAELFGSYADGRFTSDSDVDILMEFTTARVSLLMINDIKYRLEDLLKRNVDVIHGPLPDDSLIEIDRSVLIYMEHRDKIILNKVLSEIDMSKQMMGQCSFDEFESNEVLKRAVCMTVINIGELVKNLSDSCKKSYPTVPWKAISGFRDITAHKYQTLRMEDVYETVTVDFSNLHKEISRICEGINE